MSQPAPPSPPRTNTLAILALIGAFVVPPAGIVLGVLALNEIKRTGEEGRGLALGGLWVGIVLCALIVLFIIVWFVMFIWIMSLAGTIGTITTTIPTSPS